LVEKLNNETDPVKQQVMMQLFMKLRATERDILKRHETVVFKALKYK
jgi:hypothetical protein